MVWIGALIGCLDARLNRDGWPQTRRRLAGIAAVVGVLAITVLPTFGLQAALLRWIGSAGVLPLAVLASSLLAQRSLHEHVSAVAEGLERGGLDAGRTAVSRIVGRNPMALDEAGVARAAIESLAENFSDGVVAPAFWCGVLGLPGLVAYKAVNTADSMIGPSPPARKRSRARRSVGSRRSSTRR